MKYLAILFNTKFATVSVLILFGLLTLYDVKTPAPLAGKPGMYDYGSEYAEIAASLASGNGYGNVFADNSGPSAWQPPVVTFLFAAIFSLFGIKSLASLWALVAVRMACLVGTVYILQKMVDMTRFSRLKPLIVLIFGGLIIFNHKLVIGRIDDVTITIFLGVFTIYQVIALFNGQLKNKAGLYLLAFLLPLTQPSFSMVFAFGIAAYFLLQVGRSFSRTDKKSFHLPSLQEPLITAAAAGSLFLMSLGSWAAYNYSVFQKPILFKSNMWFEFYLANVLDDDGILSRQTFSSYHPFKQAPLLSEYLEYGEIAFIDTAKARSATFLGSTPEVYHQKIWNRFQNAFVYTQSVFDIRKIDTEKINNDTRQKLEMVRLVAFDNWLCLKWPKEKMVAQLQDMGIEDPAVLADWEKNKKQVQQHHRQWDERLRGLLLAGVPAFFFVIGLLYAPIRNSLTFWGVFITYLLHLTPYIFISHFERYQLSVLSLQAMAIFFPIAAIFERLLPELPNTQQAHPNPKVTVKAHNK